MKSGKFSRSAAKIGIMAARSIGLIDAVVADFWIAVLGLADE